MASKIKIDPRSRFNGNRSIDEVLEDASDSKTAQAVTTKAKAKASKKSKLEVSVDDPTKVIVRPTLVIPEIRCEVIQIPVHGISPLIVHAWSDKAKRMMLDKQMKKARAVREPKNPEEDYHACRYISDEGWDGVPVGAFKAAMVGAARHVPDLHMTIAKRSIFVHQDGYSTQKGQRLVRIDGEPSMLESMVRLETGVADIRHQAQYIEWSAVVTVEFLTSTFSAEMVVQLCEIAGWSEGICEHRPSAPKSCTGDNGRWEVLKQE